MSKVAIENVVGALALALADDIRRAADARAPEPGQAAAAINLVCIVPKIGIERLRRALGLSHPGTVRLVDRLVEDGMVVREIAPHDRRAVALSLTKLGENTARAIVEERQSGLTWALAALTPEELVNLGALAGKLLRHLVEGEDDAFAICRLCNHDFCDDCPVDVELKAEHLPVKGDHES